MKKITTILGARPQFIKAAVVSRAILNCRQEIQESIIHTGQHFDKNMSDIFFSELEIPTPDINLGIGGFSHGKNTGLMIEKIEESLLKQNPDAILVYGDTDSTLAASIAARKLNIPIFHVEAGLRSYNKTMPEEINRILTDHCSTKLFTPTSTAVSNLLQEGIPHENIYNVGDVMYDAALYYSKKASLKSSIVEDLNLKRNNYILATIHRKENTDNDRRMKKIFAGLSGTKLPIIIPLHPRTSIVIKKLRIDIPKNVTLIDPVGYLDMVMLEKNSKLIVTDSGGIQKEAFFHGIPCITLRDETEWIELVDLNTNKLINLDNEFHINDYLNLKFNYQRTCEVFGNGHCGEKIAYNI